MAKTDQEMLDKYKARIKRQNNAIKENYDRVSATLPLGTIDRIKALGLTINGVINDSVLAFLECAEESAEEPTPQEHIQIVQNAEIKQEQAETRKSSKEPEKSEIKANTTPKKDEKTEEEKTAELQAMIDEKRAKEERRKAEKEAEKERQKQKEAEELADGIRKLQQEQKERKEKELAEDKEKFEQFGKDTLKAMLNDKEFRNCVSNPIYKADFIQNYGICNYERIQKCLQEIEDEERENARKENIIMANRKN